MTGVQTCALPIYGDEAARSASLESSKKDKEGQIANLTSEVDQLKADLEKLRKNKKKDEKAQGDLGTQLAEIGRASCRERV